MRSAPVTIMTLILNEICTPSSGKCKIFTWTVLTLLGDIRSQEQTSSGEAIKHIVGFLLLLILLLLLLFSLTLLR